MLAGPAPATFESSPSRVRTHPYRSMHRRDEPSFAEVDRLVRRVASSCEHAVAVELLAIARADDRSHVTLDCATGPASAADLEGIADRVAFGIDPVALGAAPGARVRVTFA